MVVRRQHGDRPRLSNGDIHVWTVRLVDDPRETAGLMSLLDQEERARAAQFSFERDRLRFIQAHGVVRQILSDYCDVDAARLTFARNHHGKPLLVPQANGSELQFSVSHSGDFCLLAVGLDHAIGIDVEKVRDLPPAMDIAQSCFTPAESRALAALQGTARRDAFLLLWTHKEAMVKGLGVGLAANLGCLEFAFDAGGSWRLVAWCGDQSVVQRWSIRRLHAAPDCVAAVASVRPIRSLTLGNWNRTGAN